jgi:hypothetical protein
VQKLTEIEADYGQDQTGHEIVERNYDLVLRWAQIAWKGLPN